MKQKLVPLNLSFVLLTVPASAAAQTAEAFTLQAPPAQVTIASAQTQGAVSYSSVTQVNDLLGRLQNTSQAAQTDLSGLRIDRWKTDGGTKKQSLADVDSIQRNLQNALPEMISQLRSSPDDLPLTFKLYRNLDALYSVLGGLVESSGAFGPKDDFQSLSNDLNAFEGVRKQLAERLENLANSKEREIARLRTELKTAQAEVPASPPKKVVVDDTQPEKKPPAKKKITARKKPATTAPPATNPPPADQSKPQ